MPEKSEMEFSFKSAGLSGDPLNVTSFEGEEASPGRLHSRSISSPAIRRSTPARS